MVIFSHGLGGNRAVYAEHGAAYAAEVSVPCRTVETYTYTSGGCNRSIFLLYSTSLACLTVGSSLIDWAVRS